MKDNPIQERAVNVNDPHIVHCRGEGRKPNDVYGKREPRKCRKKHRHHFLSKIFLIVLIIALLGGAGFGVAKFMEGSNSPSDSSSDGMIANGENSNTSSDANIITTAENNVIIRDDEIYYDNEKIDSIDILKDRIFADYNDGETFIISDDRAIKETYDSVVNMFKEINIPYIEQ